jgi:NAD+ diphosphatase
MTARASHRRNFLAGTPLDRVGERRGDARWLAAARAEGRFLPVWKGRNLVESRDRPRPVGVRAEQLGDAGLAGCPDILLGVSGNQAWFALAVPAEASPSPAGEFCDLRGIGHLLDPDEGALLAFARAMVLWDERHTYCGRCGGATSVSEAGHARDCTSRTCGARHFPRVDPAIIVLVADEERCLLGRQAAWPEGRYSTLAGFVEPGESLEDAVAREVYEEAGVGTTDISYQSSQPWPFPSSLMLGYRARPATYDIDRRDSELDDARWFSRAEIVGGACLLPPPVSIAWRLIEDWFDSEPGRRLATEADAGPWLPRRDS